MSQYQAKRSLRNRVVMGYLIFLVLCPSALLALDPNRRISQYAREEWDTARGLPQVTVQVIRQCRKGFLWLGTQKGLVRYDGVNMRVWDQVPGTFQHLGNVKEIYEDRQGRIWVSCQVPLLVIENGVFTDFSSNPGAPKGMVLKIAETSDGVLWLGTSQGLYTFKDGSFHYPEINDSLPARSITTMVSDPKGGLWIGTDLGLSLIEDGQLIHFDEDLGLTGNQVTALHISGEKLWIATERAVTHYSDGRFTQIVPNVGAKALWEDHDKNLWLATDHGLARYKDGLLEQEPSMPKQSISLLEDLEGNLWVGYLTSGLNRLSEGVFSCWGVKEGLPGDLTVSVISDRERGGIWTGTDAGLAWFDPGSDAIEVISEREGLSSNLIYTLLQDRSGGIWVGTRHGGLNYLKEDKIAVYTTDQGLAHNAIRALHEDSTGKVWIGTYGGGVSTFLNDRFETVATREGLNPAFVYAFFEDQDGRIWIGTAGDGIYWYQNGSMMPVDQEQFRGNTIYNFHKGDAGDLWIGTNAGLVRYRDGVFQRISAKDGLCDDLSYSVIDDRRGNLWIAGISGVYILEKKEINAFFSGELPKVNCRSFGTADGMRSFECNFGGNATILNDGSYIWFPTVKGLARVNTLERRENSPVPPIYLEELITSDPVNQNRLETVFTDGLTKVEIHYTAPTFRDPDNIYFRFRLEGLEDRLSEPVKRRFAVYNKLSPGEYTFHVMASDSEGRWGQPLAIHRLIVQPHFYQTWWFYMFLVLGGICIVFVFFRLRVRQILNREHELQKLVDSRTRELVTANTDLMTAQEQLVKAAHQAGMAEIATNVLHDIGNALNSVNVTSSIIAKSVEELKIDFLSRLVSLIGRQGDALPHFLTHDHRGIKVIEGLEKVAESLVKNRETLYERVDLLDNQILRLNDIVRAQQSHVESVGAYYETVDLNQFLDQLLDSQMPNHVRSRILIVRDYAELPKIQVQKAKLKQILLHLLNNAFEALSHQTKGTVKVGTREEENGQISVHIQDNGSGIEAEHLKRIFFHGFSTKDGRDGFGLHYSANAVREMNGLLHVHSDGPKQGTACYLRIPSFAGGTVAPCTPEESKLALAKTAELDLAAVED